MKRKGAGCGRGDKMTDRITRRDALKLGTSAAVSATVSPLIRSITDHVSSVNRASSTLPDSESTVMPPTTKDEIWQRRRSADHAAHMIGDRPNQRRDRG